jgi:hypothetical protein
VGVLLFREFIHWIPFTSGGWIYGSLVRGVHRRREKMTRDENQEINRTDPIVHRRKPFYSQANSVVKVLIVEAKTPRKTWPTKKARRFIHVLAWWCLVEIRNWALLVGLLV